MLSPSLATIRLFLHVLGAAVWVGGQFALAGIVPALRRSAPDATRVVAQAFARVAWPAFGLTVITGIWSMMEIDITAASGAYQGTLLLKIGMVILSGVFAAVHAAGRSKAALAIGGALGALTSLAALFLGVLLNS